MAENHSLEAGEISSRPSERLRVFVSYARKDASDFAEYLVVALKLADFDAFLDRHDIAKGEPWENRIGSLIDGSDTVVFVLTPAAIASERCDWEVKRAEAMGKRLVPVQWIAVPETSVPVAVKRLNYTIFTPGQPFNAPMEELSVALRQDLFWLREHTRLQEGARRWQDRSRDNDLLLRGKPLADARQWVLRRQANAPEIAPIITAFIGTSEEAEAARASEERKRLDEQEAALTLREEDTRKVRQRTLLGLGSLALALAAAGLSIYFLGQARLTDAKRRVAEEQAALTAEAVTLSKNRFGRRALQKICEEAIGVTLDVATERDFAKRESRENRFWELYFGTMYLVEQVQKATNAGQSPIYKSMVDFGRDLRSFDHKDERPITELCRPAAAVKSACIEFLEVKLEPPERSCP